MLPTPDTKRELLAVELAGGASAAEAAAAVGLHQRTVEKHLASMEFRLDVARAREAIVARTMSKIVRAADKAVAKLESLLLNPDEKIQLAAAKAIIAQFASMRPNVAKPEETGDQRLYPKAKAIELESVPTEVLEAEWKTSQSTPR